MTNTDDNLALVLPDFRTTDDKLLRSNVISCQIISSEIYPIIFNSIFEEQDPRNYRSLPFLYQLKTLDGLSDLSKLNVAIALRDLYYDSNSSINRHKNLIKNLTELFDEPIVSITVDGLLLSPHPTRKHKICRFVDLNGIDDIVKQNFIKHFISNLYLGFCNPEDLSYHNMENMLCLEQTKIENIKFSSFIRLGSDIISTKINSDTVNQLLQYDQLNLYLKPFNDRQ